MFFTSLVRFVPRFSEAVEKGTVSSVYLSLCLPLVLGKLLVYVCALYLASLFTSCASFLVLSRRSLMYGSLSPANMDTLSPPLLLPSVLNRGGKSRHSCFVSDFDGNTVHLVPFYMMLALGLLYIALIMLKCVPCVTAFLGTFSI